MTTNEGHHRTRFSRRTHNPTNVQGDSKPRALNVGGEEVTCWFEHAAAYVQARLALDERGASLVEYAFLVGLIAIACLAAVAFFGSSTSSRYSNIASSVGP
jgi:Flp pilus assembly pilin Flp